MKKQTQEPDWSGTNDGFLTKREKPFTNIRNNWFFHCEVHLAHVTNCALFLNHTPEVRMALMNEALHISKLKTFKVLDELNTKKQ